MKTTPTELAKYFNLQEAERNFRNWANEDSGTWRRKLIEKLDEIKQLEEATKEELKNIFRAKDIKALISCLSSTLPSEEFWKTNYWGLHIEDCAIYEGMSIAQFLPEDINLELFVKQLKDKVDNLSTFQKYILFKEVFGFWQQKQPDLEKYIKEFGWRD